MGIFGRVREGPGHQLQASGPDLHESDPRVGGLLESSATLFHRPGIVAQHLNSLRFQTLRHNIGLRVLVVIS